MKVLVTGGAGFIGANLVRMLIEKSYRVLVLDDLSAGNLGYLKGLNSGFVEGSILDPNIVYQTVEWADSVIHLAGQTSVIDSIAHPRGDNFTINVMGSVNILDVCKMMNIKRLVFVSSNAAKQYNLSPYGASKRAAEAFCLAYHSTYGLETIILRLANVYGPYSGHKKSVIAKWFRDIADKGEIVVEGGEQTRDFIHVDDVCRAIIVALESNVSGEIFQVGTGIETSIAKLAAIIPRNDDIRVVYGDARKNDVTRSISNISKIGLMLKWQPTINLTDGLQDTWEWFNENNGSHQNQK